MSAASQGMAAYGALARSRKSLGLTQRDVSEKIGVTVSHFSRVECGHKTVTSDQFFAWADAVGCVVSVGRAPE